MVPVEALGVLGGIGELLQEAALQRRAHPMASLAVAGTEPSCGVPWETTRAGSMSSTPEQTRTPVLGGCRYGGELGGGDAAGPVPPTGRCDLGDGGAAGHVPPTGGGQQHGQGGVDMNPPIC